MATPSPVAANAALRGVTAPSAVTSRVFYFGGQIPESIVIGPDGNVWFTASAGGGPKFKRAFIGRLTPEGVFTRFKMPPNLQPIRIVSGTDGNLWTNVQNGVVKIGVSGATTYYPINSDAFYCCQSIAPAANGDLWLGGTESHSQSDAGALISIDDSGNVLGYFFQTLQTPGTIVPATAGSVWTATTIVTHVETMLYTALQLVSARGFSKYYKIKRLSTSVVLGGDGNFWAPHYGERIARITPDGVLTDFPVGVHSTPQALTVAPDGTIWFGARTPKGWVAAHLNLQGTVVARYPLKGLASFGPIALCVGNDGKVWVAGYVPRVGINGAPQNAGQIEELTP